MGLLPRYVPPHLEGRVSDFQHEPNGMISFSHPEAAWGLDPTRARVSISPEQYKHTFDKAHRQQNVMEAISNQYSPMQDIPETPAREMNNMIGRGLRGAWDWGTSNQGKAVGTVGMLGALAGGAGKYLWDRRTGNRPSIKSSLLAALLIGGLGAAGTAYGQNKFQRRENYLMNKMASVSDIAVDIIRLLENDPSLSHMDRARILDALVGAPQQTKSQLLNLMRTAGGVGVGMLAMRFLGAKGLLPMAAGGILGGLIGSRLGGDGLERNPYGQVSITNYL